MGKTAKSVRQRIWEKVYAIITIIVGVVFVLCLTTQTTSPKAAPPPLEESINQSIQDLEGARSLITELEQELEQLRKVNEDLSQVQLDLQDFERLFQEYASQQQRLAWIRTGVAMFVSLFGGWLLGSGTSTVKKFLGRAFRRRP